MNIKGLQKTSLIDYPGKICSVIFTGGCNLRCGNCHNPELACNANALSTLSNQDALAHLAKRRGVIDGVSITGGEPTLAENLDGFIGSIKGLSLAVKIDTNGLNPDRIERLLNRGLVDYVAVDVKTSPEKYPFLTKARIDFSRIIQTIELLRNSGIDYEVRTTCIPHYVTFDDFSAIRERLGRVKNYYLQQFSNDITLDPTFGHINPYSFDELMRIRDFVSTFADHCAIRGM